VSRPSTATESAHAAFARAFDNHVGRAERARAQLFYAEYVMALARGSLRRSGDPKRADGIRNAAVFRCLHL